jgi:hypothetical protein
MYDIKVLPSISLYPDIEIRYYTRYRINIECTKTVEIEYRTRCRQFPFDIVSISSVQGRGFWSVLNIVTVPDIVYTTYLIFSDKTPQVSEPSKFFQNLAKIRNRSEMFENRSEMFENIVYNVPASTGARR